MSNFTSSDTNIFAENPRSVTLAIGSAMGGMAYLASSFASSLDPSIPKPPPRPNRVPVFDSEPLEMSQGPASIEIGDSVPVGETKIRRSYKSTHELVTSPAAGITTLPDVLEHAAKTFPTANAVGWRDIIKVHKEVKKVTKVIGGKEITEDKVWEFYELSDYKYWTFKQFLEEASVISNGLAELGLTKEHKFNIYSSTKPAWQIMANACGRQAITFATAYDSLGVEGLEHSINEPDVVGLFTNSNLLTTLASVIDKTPTLKYVIYDGESNEKAMSKIQELRPDVRVLSYDELRELGTKNEHPTVKADPEDIACIMYTSGSTGKPKGVLITHTNLIASIGGVHTLLGDFLDPKDALLAYLPLAHILEFIVELSCISMGVVMGYGAVKTLTDASVRNCVGDIKAFKPTVMVGVPAVWELIRKGILSKVKAGGKLKERVFNGAMFLKKSPLPFVGGLMDTVVFKQVREQTGGRLRYALSGGAALSRETQEFLSNALVTVLQGYGLTESCGMCAILPPDYMQYGAVGAPVPSIEVKLVDVPDAGYFSTNTPLQQGEVWIRGPSVTKGYFKREDVTKESITEDGWFKTGDIAQWNPDGTLAIIDRKKNLIKLAGGEYIALEKLESIYKSCSLVNNLCVHADSNANRPMAIVLPHEKNLDVLCKEIGLGGGKEFGLLCSDEKVKEVILKELNEMGKKAGFKPLEMIQCVILSADEWTPENGCVTAAQKLNRREILNRYQDEVKKVYP
ncbi:uncharacterized protein MELLADRAFT_102462 [Melampsora larici-populina 98AG31]|uniref:AMP-dependent synthetase/ligase domain-containing protein n=1 Tax=Melampsora larici-populina (strain 98AG31 / pathotype 3-4-7) TaxID=747676 RepID=F4R8E3_MELLP|nr:uncharacterized protein MELLADRAFT_102462 [Melampsora larici-populina 98AG31]EGG11621.1 hypothetical protein MELLADRAFT_102462 [Melampsora larici-populina 98AG31]